MKPDSEFVCEKCEDEGYYYVNYGYVDNVDSRGGYHGSDQLSRLESCDECPECRGCNKFISAVGTKDEWGYFHPAWHDEVEEEKAYWCSSKCLVKVMMDNYKTLTEYA